MAAERESSGALARAGKNLISLEIYLQHGKINHQMVLYVIAKAQCTSLKSMQHKLLCTAH